MLSFGQAHVWTSGYVVAGLVGVALLLASGVFLTIQVKALGEVLEKMAANGADQAPPPLVPSALVVAIGIALPSAMVLRLRQVSTSAAPGR